MSVEPSNFYARWRVQNGIVAALREGDEPPPERLLQAVWQHQRIRRDNLTASDGRSVRILHPGFLSREGGPDFRGAIVQFENELPRSGDIEVDLRSNGWQAHGHDRNPTFKNVILHVTWEEERTNKSPHPVLTLSKRLDAPVNELNTWLGTEASESLPPTLRGLCNAPLRELTGEQLASLLNEAGWVRFCSKANQFQARARQSGWEQSLWEGLFRALGYKHNPWPMQCLAEKKSRWFGRGLDAEDLQSRLLGLSGLLPDELTRTQKSADTYLSRMWNQWWRERDEYADCTLPRALWKLHGQRPANHPQRRLALAAHWLSTDDLPGKVTRWCAAAETGKQAEASLLKLLQSPDDFWAWHWTMRSPRLKRAQPMLGAARVTDVAVNVILPWLWARAAEGKNEKVQRDLQERFFSWPAAEDNSTLKLARQRLLEDTRAGVLKTAAMQQGLIQIVRDFCDRSNAVCDHCRFPELVKARFR